MRFQPILCVALAAAFALPLSAHAGKWPAGTRETFLQECNASATNNVEQKKVTSYCNCAADTVTSKFNDKEIAELNSTNPPPTVSLRDRMLKEVKVCNQ
ncbi:hypothetical protein [Pseudomonas sp. R5(2019)]|uniref:hypothetical protein n=1 Tax=Pseudomonas sp. R5(2019) TaxID=2697566 RepID=UPI001412BCD3|nr:hypothetical protein [Pseudomonas sp. R5(2019)]NBA95559.1 hypothetical protein [Pseudomonas sp. R5(2019)]